MRVLAWYLACKHASGYLKILYAIFAIIYIISLPGDCHAYARNDKVWGHPHPNGYIFEAFLYTQCATSKTEHEPQGGENMSAELDG